MCVGGASQSVFTNVALRPPTHTRSAAVAEAARALLTALLGLREKRQRRPVPVTPAPSRVRRKTRAYTPRAAPSSRLNKTKVGFRPARGLTLCQRFIGSLENLVDAFFFFSRGYRSI